MIACNPNHTCKSFLHLQSARIMALLKLNRINKGGEILINTEHILLVEVESRSTTIQMTHNLIFSVEKRPMPLARNWSVSTSRESPMQFNNPAWQEKQPDKGRSRARHAAKLFLL
jgi:hypothetical protein